MKKIDRYLHQIISDLPIEEKEKEELREELYCHLNEHIKELMVKGYSEDEAVKNAMESFGTERKLNWEMRKVLFPLYKVFRYLFGVIFVTALFCFLSYSIMEYAHPEFDNTIPAYSVVSGMFLIALFTGAAEVIYEAVQSEFQSKWFTNPWIIIMVPALIIGVLMARPLFENPEDYQDGLWIDLFVIPLGALLYLLSRQIFDILFLPKNNNYHRKRVS